MLWCPQCELKHQKGYDICLKCGTKLIAKIMVNTNIDVYLITVSSESESDILESLLKSNNIPIKKKYKQQYGYLKILSGIAGTGIDIYIQSNFFNKAKAVLKHNPTMKERIFINVSNRQMYENKRLIWTWIFLTILVMMLFISILVFIVSDSKLK